MKKNIIYLTSILFFAFIFVVFYIGLDKPNSYIPKQSNNKTIEDFTSNELFSDEKVNSHEIIKNNKFTLINIWSSWCVPCREEHKVLMILKEKNLNILGLNYKDKKNNAINFLNKLGNPFAKIFNDKDGLISISLGAYGVPESFLLNNEFKVLKKFIGPLTEENIIEITKIINNENN